MSNVSPQQVRQVIQRSRLVMQRDVARWASDVALVRQRGVACHQMATHRPRANAASLLQIPLILEAKDTALRRRGRAIHGCRASSNHASASEAVVPGSCAISRDEESSAGCHTAGEDGPLWNNEQCVGIQNAGTIAVRPESPSACKRRNVQRVRQGSRPVSAVHLRSWGLTLPSRGRATSGFASCRPPLMSNVSPQLNAANASSLRRTREQCGVAHQTVTRC